ncbi:MAG: hypothetical protein JRI23_02195 [Deltaproteobacteria bacterium]|jgi:hypothetical protein|nr:hypothetical protein [Deltaproteobacteria bacterium]MBW2530290.1 hypothetical protein [Deltaproteobacteria bacterium]
MTRSFITALCLLAVGELFALVAIVGCEGDVEQAQEPDAGSAGSSSTGSGGDGTGAGPQGEAAPPYCGGEGEIPCADSEFCEYIVGDCGADGRSGICQPRPVGCDDDCPRVCGCDGETYCNECEANSAGVDVSTDGSCSSTSAEYSAHLWLGGLDHLIIMKADPVRDICVRLYADWPMEHMPGFVFTMPDGWGVSRASVSNRASDCADWDTQPTGEVVEATGGSGSIAWSVPQGMYYPCELDIDADLAFATTSPWVPASEALLATFLPIDGGCL